MSLKPIAFRLRPEVHARLREMAELADRPMVEVVSKAIDTFYEAEFQGARTLAEQQAQEGVALVRKLEERLGRAFWREDGVTELSFAMTEHGRPIVIAGAHRYLEHEDGRLLQAHVRGGNLLVAPIEEDGSIGDRMALPVGEPALN